MKIHFIIGTTISTTEKTIHMWAKEFIIIIH